MALSLAGAGSFPARLLLAAWLATTLLLDFSGGRSAHCAKAAPSHRAGRQRRRQRGDVPRGGGGPPPSDRRGLAGAADAREGKDEPSASYFERHGLAPPPLPSHRRAPATDAADGAAEVPLLAFRDAPADLESIMRNARMGRSSGASLRSDLLEGYDKHDFPWEYVWYNQTNRTGLPVEIGINFHRINSVDILNSVMDMNVWFRIRWADPRLTWNPNEYGGLNETKMWIGDGGAGGETSEIWTPDVKLWNSDVGLDSLEDAYAFVSHKGIVFWSRLGHLRPACKFSGLNKFPFDRLECAMEFGSWTNTRKFLRMEKLNETGFSMGGSQTAGESYDEFSFAKEGPVRCEAKIYEPYIEAPEDDWSVLVYNLAFERSWQPYVRGYVVQQILLNIVGFAAFWLPPCSGERMGLSITAMLAAVASEMIVAESLPLAREVTWLSRFSTMSMLFTFFALMECVVVLHLYDKRGNNLVPPWFAFAKKKLLRQNNDGEAQTQAEDEVAGRAGLGTAVDALSNTINAQVTSMRKSTAARSQPLDGGVFGNSTKPKTGSPGSGSDAGAKDSQSGNLDSKYAGGPNCKIRRRCTSSTLVASASYAESRIDDSQFFARDADVLCDGQEKENTAKWKVLSERIDDHARFWMPLAYAIALIIMFAEVL